METQTDGFLTNFWQKNRIIFKGFLIAILALLLLIPAAFVTDLVRERQNRQQEAVEEISSKWAGVQTIAGPVICLPYLHPQKDDKGNIVNIQKTAYFLPENLKIQSTLEPEERSRGIYKVVVYSSDIQLSGRFGALDIPSLGIPSTNFLWNEAYILFALDDVRGIKEEVRITLGANKFELVPGRQEDAQFQNALTAKINLSVNDTMVERSFALDLKLRGSRQLSFLPLGKKTTVNVTSQWPDPSFNGSYLPDSRNVSSKGFDATWNVLYLNRNFPQQWRDRVYELNKASFGVDLIVPIDAYQKSMRSVKYALLCIVLTFTAFLLIELIYARPIHPFQYVLIGFALILFYTLLVSISEYLSFNMAYLIATVATVSLVTIFVRSVLQSQRIASFICLILLLLYGFIFVLIQSQDYALLMGSVGLFITLALVMYFSRKAKWEHN